jgi:hypothetical protein
VKLEFRPMTNSQPMRDNAAMMSSTTPPRGQIGHQAATTTRAVGERRSIGTRLPFLINSSTWSLTAERN